MFDKPENAINLDLTTVEGNAYSILAAFSKQAKKEGWTKEEIDKVTLDAKSSSYMHLLNTIAWNCDVRPSDN